jgi:hypothetical protein
MLRKTKVSPVPMVLPLSIFAILICGVFMVQSSDRKTGCARPVDFQTATTDLWGSFFFGLVGWGWDRSSRITGNPRLTRDALAVSGRRSKDSFDRSTMVGEFPLFSPDRKRSRVRLNCPPA